MRQCRESKIDIKQQRMTLVRKRAPAGDELFGTAINHAKNVISIAVAGLIFGQDAVRGEVSTEIRCARQAGARRIFLGIPWPSPNNMRCPEMIMSGIAKTVDMLGMGIGRVSGRANNRSPSPCAREPPCRMTSPKVIFSRLR
jgi:hypothetical protein